MEQEEISLKYIVEGLLFASGEPLTINKISDIVGKTTDKIEEVVDELKNNYQDEQRCFDIIKKGEEGNVLYQIVTNKNISSYIQKLHNTVLEGDLTKSSLEVLSIIMYRGPLNRSEIDEIRGVNSSYILRALTLRGLINRHQNPKRKTEYLYEPSFDLLKHLGITDIASLPEYEDLNKLDLKEIIEKEALAKEQQEERDSGLRESNREEPLL